MTERRPRILVFSREYPPVTVGGTSIVARNLAVGLAALGWQVIVLSAHPSQEQDVRETASGVIVHRTGTRLVYDERSGLSDQTMLSHRRLYQAAGKLAAEFGLPDVIALPDLFCYPEAALAAKAWQVPIVNILLQDFRTLTRHDRDAHRVTTGVSADAGHLMALEEKSLRGSAHIVFISQALSDAVTAHYRDLATSHSVVHLGVDGQEIGSVAAADSERAELVAGLGLAHGQALLVGVGRLVPVKGYGALLTAMALVRDCGPPPHLALVGVGPEEQPLRELAAELGIADRVSFIGGVPRRVALTWMSLATVGVVPSLWESFCYVCAEMMALGRPVVASAVDSLNELIPDDRYGYRVPVSLTATGARHVEPADLAAAIGQALSDPREAARRAAAARQRALGEFTNARFAGGMAELCASLGRTVTRG